MLGLVFYSAISAGLGCLLPMSLRSGMGMIGVRFSLGYSAMVILVYMAHVQLGLSLGVTVGILVIFSMVGVLIRVRGNFDRSDLQQFILHPAPLLIVFGGTVVIVNGGIAYLPFGNDEFSVWLATPRLIHLSGSWAAVVDSLIHSHYTPGWQLTLLLPWQLLGKEDFGMSAAAPFVLHVTVIALIFDIVVFQLRRRMDMTLSVAIMLAWAFVLLFLAAEATGRLWTYTLLIEQPQIYSYTTILLLMFTAEATGDDQKFLYGAAGIILASAYLYKVAAMIFIPAIIGLSCIFLFDRKKIISERLMESLLSVTLLIGPVLVVMFSWKMSVDSNSCSFLSLSQDQFAQASSRAAIFSSAIWTYVVGYKFILTLAASLGVVGALLTGKYRATLVLTLSGTCYFMILYLYHLTCFGPINWDNLISIPRFTRVLLQTFHALGLVMLFDTVLILAAKRYRNLIGEPNHLWNHSWIVGAFAIIVAVMAAWQVRMLFHSVVDTTTRVYQNVDTRIAEVRMAANRIESFRGHSLPRRPIVTFLSQKSDSAILNYAYFYALGYSNDKISPHFTVSHAVSWSSLFGNDTQEKAHARDVIKQLSLADIVWPISIDPWLIKIIESFVPEKSCLNALPDQALFRYTDDKNSVRFRCIEKIETDTDTKGKLFTQ